MYAGMPEHDKAAVTKAIRAALRRNWTVSVWDSEEWTIKRGNNEAAILDACGNTDFENLRIRDSKGEIMGTLVVIYGNGPGETIADYTCCRDPENLTERDINWAAYIAGIIP